MQVTTTIKRPAICSRPATDTHTLFFTFSCGHEYFDKRRAGSVSGCDNCLCDSCQPYNAVIAVSHPCRLCGGSFSYFTNTPQTLLSNEEAARRTIQMIPLYESRSPRTSMKLWADCEHAELGLYIKWHIFACGYGMAALKHFIREEACAHVIMTTCEYNRSV
jgi:hypothetical protein